jgi:hypothetical protein
MQFCKRLNLQGPVTNSLRAFTYNVLPVLQICFQVYASHMDDKCTFNYAGQTNLKISSLLRAALLRYELNAVSLLVAPLYSLF